MKKIMRVLTTITLTTTTSNNLIACDNGQAPQQINLNDVIKKHDLQQITMANITPTSDELLTAIKANNAAAQVLKTTDFMMKAVTSTNATIVGIGKYDGQVNLTYTKKPQQINLQTIILNKYLAEIYIGQKNKPEKINILHAIKAKNLRANLLNENVFAIKGVVSTTAVTIVGKNNYHGEVQLKYETTNFEKRQWNNQTIDYLTADDFGNVYLSSNGKLYKCHKNEATFMAVTGLDREIIKPSLIKDDKNGNLYVGTHSGKVYKCGKDQMQLTKINGWFGHIEQLLLDKNDNVYVISDHKLYQCLGNSSNFNQMSDLADDATNIVIANNNAYVTSSNHKLYKYSINENKFTVMSGLSGDIVSIAATSNNNLYVASSNHKLYKCGDNENNFTEMQQLSAKVDQLVMDSNNNAYVRSANKLYRCLEHENKFTVMNGLSCDIENITTDNNGNVIIETETAKRYRSIVIEFYKCLKGELNFTKINGLDLKFNEIIEKRYVSTTTNNFYVITFDHDHKKAILYKCQSQSLQFQTMMGVTGEIKNLTTDSNGNLYVTNNSANLYISEK